MGRKFLQFLFFASTFAFVSTVRAQLPAPILKAQYDQKNQRTNLSWTPQGTWRLYADLKYNFSLRWRGSQVYDQRGKDWILIPFSGARWTKLGNELYQRSNSGGIWYYSKGFYLKDYTFSFQFRIPSTIDDDMVGIIFRMKDSRNYYLLYICGRERYANCRYSRLQRIVNGRPTNLKAWDVKKYPNYAWYIRRRHVLRVVVQGNTYAVYLDKNLLVKFSDRFFSNGTVGFYLNSQDNVYFDYFTLSGSGTIKRAFYAGDYNSPFQKTYAKLHNSTVGALLKPVYLRWLQKYPLYKGSITRTELVIIRDPTLFTGMVSRDGRTPTPTDLNSYPYGKRQIPPMTWRISADITATRDLTWTGNVIASSGEWRRVLSNSSWRVSGTDLIITTNGNAVKWINTKYYGAKNYTVELDFTVKGSDDDYVGINFRYRDERNHYYIFLCGVPVQNCGRSDVRKIVNGRTTYLRTWNLRTNPSMGWRRNVRTRLRIVAQNNRFSIFLNNNLVHSFTDNSLAVGSFGFYVSSNPNTYIHNFKAYNLSVNYSRAVFSSIYTNNIASTRFTLLRKETASQLISRALSNWASQNNIPLSKIKVNRYYMHILNFPHLFDGMLSLNGRTAIYTDGRARPYGRFRFMPFRYKLYRNGRLLTTVYTESYTDRYPVCRVKPGTTYKYSVSAVDTGNREGRRSSPEIPVQIKNSPPTIKKIPDQVGYRNTPWTFDLSRYIADPDGPSSRIVISTNSQYIRVNGLKLTFSYPTSVRFTSQTVTLIARDCYGSPSKVEFKVILKNRKPVISSKPSDTAVENQTYSYTVVGRDADGDPVTYTLTKGPKGAKIDSKTGKLTWTPGDADALKSFTFEVRVCDDRKGCTTQTWRVKVKNVNDPPKITTQPKDSVKERDTYTYSPQVSDPDPNDTHKWQLVKGPNGAKIDPKTGKISWKTSSADVNKSFSFEVKVCDNSGACDTQKWTVKVTNVNDPPKITSKPPQNAYVGQSYNYGAQATDPDPNDNLSWKLVKGPKGAKIDPKTGKLTWTPDPNDADNPVEFEIQVCDNGNPPACDTQKFKVTPRRSCRVDADCKKGEICAPQASIPASNPPTVWICQKAGCLDGTTTCAKNEVCVHGQCQPNKCLGVKCAQGEFCRPDTGKCVKPCAGVTCGPDQYCEDGQCKDILCGNNKCKSGEVCVLKGGVPTCEADQCGAKSCRFGRTCHLGHCRDDLCTAISCPDPKTQLCQNNICSDRPKCTVDIDCKGDMVCVEEYCFDAGCYLKKCKDGEICIDGKCQTNYCSGQSALTCQPPKEYCSPTSDKCKKSCAGVNCPDGEKCVDGQCVKDPCNGVTCQADEVCIGGKCEKSVCTAPNRCKHSRICSKAVNKCVDDLCKNIKCPKDQVCKNGQCVEEKCKFDADCPKAEQICVNNACVTVECKDKTECQTGELCKDGKCVKDPCDGVTCRDGQFCREGQCVDSCASIFCPDGEMCIDGKCVKNPCDGVTCQNDETCVKGKCVKDPCGGNQLCKNNRLCSPDGCSDNPCDAISCPGNLQCDPKTAQCRGDKDCKTDADCPTGTVCVNGACRPASEFPKEEPPAEKSPEETAAPEEFQADAGEPAPEKVEEVADADGELGDKSSTVEGANEKSGSLADTGVFAAGGCGCNQSPTSPIALFLALFALFYITRKRLS